MDGSMKNSIEEHQRVVGLLVGQVDLLERIADRIIACFEARSRLYVLGNGGSAADAQHIAAELVGRFKEDRRALSAVALTTDTSILTAVSNDIGFEHVFERQVEALVNAGDIVWALSVSGRSPNVLRALQQARSKGAFRIGFTGRAGVEMLTLCDLGLQIDHSESDRVQEAHQLAYHLICAHIERHYAGS
jgi:D-sedoheptulose 7-phosphate isomerase